MLSSIKGLTALVTGGGSGLGLAVCQRLARNGARVVTLDLTPPTNLTNVIPVAGDIRKDEDIHSALKLCTDDEGKPKLNVLINCAGVSNAFKTYNFSTNKPQRLQDFRDLTEINIIGTFNVIRLSVPLLAENPTNESGTKAAIINTSSILAMEGHEGQVGFSASQMAINSMTLPLARDLSKQGIRVNTIATGFIETPLITRTNAQELYDYIIASTPLPSRLGQPDEFALLVQSIIENNMLNGEIIRLDGAARWPERN